MFDTTENKYIRLFLFKYFNIKAIVSLPQLTFEPFTSTKTSLLFAQKKTKEEVKQWNERWDNYGKEWSRLKTRVVRYYDYFINGGRLNKKFAWVKELTTDLKKLSEQEDSEAIKVINDDDLSLIKTNIKRFLKDYIIPEDDELEVTDLLTKYGEEIETLAKYDKETDMFGFYNAWWVFGEVAKEMDYDIFMAQAENVGYKRTKRGENPMSNDLYEIEYAPNTLDTKAILDGYDLKITALEESMEDIQAELDLLDRQKSSKKFESLTSEIEYKKQSIERLQVEKSSVISIFDEYYENDKLKSEFSERTNTALIGHFKNGLLSKYRSDDIVLRSTEMRTILDLIRKEVVWA